MQALPLPEPVHFQGIAVCPPYGPPHQPLDPHRAQSATRLVCYLISWSCLAVARMACLFHVSNRQHAARRSRPGFDRSRQSVAAVLRCAFPVVIPGHCRRWPVPHRESQARPALCIVRCPVPIGDRGRPQSRAGVFCGELRRVPLPTLPRSHHTPARQDHRGPRQVLWKQGAGCFPQARTEVVPHR